MSQPAPIRSLSRLQLSPRTVDVLFTLGLLILVTRGVATGSEPHARDPDVLAYVLTTAISLLQLFRRDRPMEVLIASAILDAAYHGLSYPGGPPRLAVYVAIYSAAAAGYRIPSAIVTVVLSLMGLVGRSVLEGEPLFSIGVTSDPLLMIMAFLLGDAMHSRRAYEAEVRERLRLAEVEREREAKRRVADERLRIARELHDIMAHTISAVMVQAELASDVIDSSTEQARRALREIRAEGREAMSELRATVGLLRGGGGAPREPLPGLSGLDALAEVVKASGLQVDISRTGEPRDLPAAVEVTAYRIAQEALTNVLRHAQAQSVRVEVAYDPSALTLEVRDDGRKARERPSPGHGLNGMRERAEALGGTLEAGWVEGGWRVYTRLPLKVSPSELGSAPSGGRGVGGVASA